MNKYLVSMGCVLLASYLCVSVAAPMPDESVKQENLQPIAEEAYIYFYPLILMDITRKQSINMDPKSSPMAGPANSFVNLRTFPPADLRTVVRPNFDTLYSVAWLDLNNGPVIVSNENTDGRYFLLQMLDMWTDTFAAPGKRTSGTEAAAFAIVPPGWTGDLPKDVQRINAPTPNVWVIGRTQTNGTKDYDAVHKVQDGYKVTLLADWGKEPQKIEQKIDHSVDTKTEPMRLVSQMPVEKYFQYGAELMNVNPPHLSDWSIVERMKRIGIEPGKFDSSKVDSDTLSKAAKSGLKKMHDLMPKIARITNGWQMNTTTMGVYGNDYLKRAVVAQIGLGANAPEDAIYPINIADANGKPVMAENNYVLHFNKNEIPPVDAFWSLTLYDAEGFQVPNALNRFSIGSSDALHFNSDGSLDLYIQHKSPGEDKESNWLPAPKSGKLGLTMRLYAPKQSVVDGLWNPPAIKKAK